MTFKDSPRGNPWTYNPFFSKHVPVNSRLSRQGTCSVLAVTLKKEQRQEAAINLLKETMIPRYPLHDILLQVDRSNLEDLWGVALFSLCPLWEPAVYHSCSCTPLLLFRTACLERHLGFRINPSLFIFWFFSSVWVYSILRFSVFSVCICKTQKKKHVLISQRPNMTKVYADSSIATYLL